MFDIRYFESSLVPMLQRRDGTQRRSSVTSEEWLVFEHKLIGLVLPVPTIRHSTFVIPGL